MLGSLVLGLEPPLFFLLLPFFLQPDYWLALVVYVVNTSVVEGFVWFWLELVCCCNDTYPIEFFTWLTVELMSPSTWGLGVAFVRSVYARGAFKSILYNMPGRKYMRSNYWDLNIAYSFDCAPIIIACLHISGLKDFKNQSMRNFLGIYALIILLLRLHSWIISNIWFASF